MASLNDFNASARPYKRRKEAGKIPLHTSIALQLEPATPILELAYVSVHGVKLFHQGRVQFVVILIAFYEKGYTVEKRFGEFDDGTIDDNVAQRILQPKDKPVFMQRD